MSDRLELTSAEQLYSMSGALNLNQRESAHSHRDLCAYLEHRVGGVQDEDSPLYECCWWILRRDKGFGLLRHAG